MVFRGQSLGKYRIVEPLGSGGFGTVYLAEDTWIDKRVAIKVPHRQSLDFGELLREPRLLASLNHPNIVTVITAEKQDNVFFIVMEYVPGETLETIIATKGALDLPTVLDYTCQIANAVEHAHKQGVIHRDLRPANVFVTEKGLLKVGDFGTSRFLEIAAHGTTVIGSPPYMAPEQFEGRAVFASDLYSLGVTMYQMLTGTLPYDTPAPSDLDRLKRGELVEPLRLRRPRRRRSSSTSSCAHLPATSARATSARKICCRISSTRARKSCGARRSRRQPRRSPCRGRRRPGRSRPRASGRVKSARAASAGIAASRCRSGAAAAPSAAKRSKIAGAAGSRRRPPFFLEQPCPSTPPTRCG